MSNEQSPWKEYKMVIELHLPNCLTACTGLTYIIYTQLFEKLHRVFNKQKHRYPLAKVEGCIEMKLNIKNRGNDSLKHTNKCRYIFS